MPCTTAMVGPKRSSFSQAVKECYGKCKDNDHGDGFIQVSNGKYGNSPEDKDQRPEVPDDPPSEVNKSKISQQDQNSEGNQDNGPENMSEFHKVGY